MGYVEIYTDGSDKGRWGSWSYLILVDGKFFAEAAGRERKTNSNRMEFQAAINALEFLSTMTELRNAEVTLSTDCKILIDNVGKFPQWQAAGWLRHNQLPIANSDLFQKLYALLQMRKVSWKWVRAHSGNRFNDRCDELCRAARAG